MTPRDEMTSIFHLAGELALEQIAKHGHFIPFAVVIEGDGGLSFVNLGPDIVKDGGEKDLAKVRKILQAGAKEGQYTATAIASDVRVRLKETGEVSDAVRVELEHVNAEPMTCILPYRRNQKAVEQHVDPYVEPGERVVFS